MLSLLGGIPPTVSLSVDDLWDGPRWDRELDHDLTGLGFNGDSLVTAQAINEMTKMRLGEALEAGEDVRSAFRWDEEVLDASQSL